MKKKAYFLVLQTGVCVHKSFELQIVFFAQALEQMKGEGEGGHVEEIRDTEKKSFKDPRACVQRNGGPSRGICGA